MPRGGTLDGLLLRNISHSNKAGTDCNTENVVVSYGPRIERVSVTRLTERRPLRGKITVPTLGDILQLENRERF